MSVISKYKKGPNRFLRTSINTSRNNKSFKWRLVDEKITKDIRNLPENCHLMYVKCFQTKECKYPKWDLVPFTQQSGIR